jgi:hypothetical protein
MSLDSLVNDFNSTLIDLVENIGAVCPNTIIGNNMALIKKVLTSKDNQNKVIDTFVAKVLIYKPQIDVGDESFFLNKSYDDDLDDVDAGGSITGKIFEFKNVWITLSSENKDLVIQYMQLLCMLGQQYFLETDTGI